MESRDCSFKSFIIANHLTCIDKYKLIIIAVFIWHCHEMNLFKLKLIACLFVLLHIYRSPRCPLDFFDITYVCAWGIEWG